MYTTKWFALSTRLSPLLDITQWHHACFYIVTYTTFTWHYLLYPLKLLFFVLWTWWWPWPLFRWDGHIMGQIYLTYAPPPGNCVHLYFWNPYIAPNPTRGVRTCETWYNDIIMAKWRVILKKIVFSRKCLLISPKYVLTALIWQKKLGMGKFDHSRGGFI